MPPPRPRGVGYSTGVSSTRPNPNTPMSERQQMALLIQMTATSTPELNRQNLKKNDHKKYDEMDDINLNEKDDTQDAARDKISADETTVQSKKDIHTDIANAPSVSCTNQGKRNFSDVDEEDIDDVDDVKKKKRKDSDNGRESKASTSLRVPGRTEKYVKPTGTVKNNASFNKSCTTSEKDQVEISKPILSKTFETDGDDDDFKISESIYSGSLKVPPLKIVIPQQNCSLDTDGNVSRTGKVNALRSAALPYVVSSESNERDPPLCSSPHESPIKIGSICTIIDEKNIKILNEDKNLHRVLRSSNRSGVTGLERSSNNSSPQMQSNSPSPASLNPNDGIENKTSFSNITTSPTQQNFDHENMINLPSPSTSSTSSSKDTNPTIVELHPRKRKIRSRNDESNIKPNVGNSNNETSSIIMDSHPHDFPFVNCFQMYLNIRKQIEKKWKNVYPVKPRPPQGYSEYLINKRSYLLAGKNGEQVANIPDSISAKMKEIFIIQEKERNELIQRHIVEREKLCLNVEQEIIRVHSKAARNIACQSVPFSVCSFLKDEEVYNIITPEQEEKERSARYRFNGRLLLSWLQDVDDKWEKIKESMVLRHHNESESLHAVQLMDWEIALKKYELCDFKSQLEVEQDHVPIVHVSEDFDLLPA